MSEQILFEKDNRALEDIFPKDGNYIFLVGAGISMNAPSSLPSAVKIVNNLINLCAPEEEIEDLQKIEDLRYEWLVEAIQEHVDKKLRFLENSISEPSESMKPGKTTFPSRSIIFSTL